MYNLFNFKIHSIIIIPPPPDISIYHWLRHVEHQIVKAYLSQTNQTAHHFYEKTKHVNTIFPPANKSLAITGLKIFGIWETTNEYGFNYKWVSNI